MPTLTAVRQCILIPFVCLLAGLTVHAENGYKLGPESTNRLAGVPRGKVEKFQFTESKIFPDTTRDCWIYIPAQYDGSKLAALMVFQDGGAYVSETGDQRVPIVFDNLIAKSEMPVTIGIFINPGNRTSSESPGTGTQNRSNRSFEYDSLGDAYVRFLLNEFLPFTASRFNVKLTDD